MRNYIAIILLLIAAHINAAQPSVNKNYIERELRYHPNGDDFVIVNGKNRFNRALYGTNNAFRIETGDMPEFGLFMPNMGGNIQMGIVSGSKSLWLNDAEYIQSIYRAGSRIYEIKDPILGTGKLIITVLAIFDAEGLIIKIEQENIPDGLKLITTYGGANNARFFRNGDLGVDDPEVFSLKPEACKGNIFSINKETFKLEYGAGTRGGPIVADGVFSKGTTLKTGSPYKMASIPELIISEASNNEPILIAQTSLSGENVFLSIKVKDSLTYLPLQLSDVFNKSEEKRKKIASSVIIKTPDAFINTLGGVLSIAADGIWDDDTEVWQHGAIGWRMPLNGWRAAYVGDAIGWHDRARKHFNGYAESQITEIEPFIPHPTQDSTLNLTRAEKKWGTQMYSNGYIGRNPHNTTQMHHYNMNLVYIDELLWHFNWTGDMDYVKKMWPTLKRHLEWEKKNFDPNNDGLYDAYACIWASDALQYNSGSVTYSSAYNYRANKMAAEIAEKIGEDPEPYREEANKILNAINSTLWLPNKGWWAEFKDYMGNKTIHPNAGVWTVYHAIDSDIHTPFQAYQATRYIDNEIPHIAVKAKGLEDENYQTISTTNWLPYSWSVNNVAFAEVAHTSLAYWQTGRNEEAFKLFKSNILDGMYLGASPGNIGQISFYDAARGECYRDFGDPIGVYSRTLIQGLYGIIPDAMNSKLVVKPGFPAEWNFASIETSDILLDFKRDESTDRYIVKPSFDRELALSLILKAQYDQINSILVNGETTEWKMEETAGYPAIRIDCRPSTSYTIIIEWIGNKINNHNNDIKVAQNSRVTVDVNSPIKEVYDPQQVIQGVTISGNLLSGVVNGITGNRTLFVKTVQGDMVWWKAIEMNVIEPLGIDYNPEESDLSFSIVNNSDSTIIADVRVNGAIIEKSAIIPANGKTKVVQVKSQNSYFGSNLIELVNNNSVIFTDKVINWNIKNSNTEYETINIDNYLNTSVNQIFKVDYLSPRSPFTTLQIPKQGIGEWCHPTLTAEIDDSGIRKNSYNGIFNTPFGIPFRTPSDNSNNIAFTSLWDNYPTFIDIPLNGKSSHAYLLMAGTTNHMQVHITNGEVIVKYKDGTTSILKLVNPETWMPIEQDLYLDGQAFQSKLPKPYRVALKSGVVSRSWNNIIPHDEVYGRSIDGGAGVILDIPLDKTKELESLQVKTIANEVIIGLMSVTLTR